MIEDEDKKARRNLLVLSSGVLAVWFLKIPIDGHLIGIANLSNVAPWKAWALVALVLLYLGLRFQTSPETELGRRNWAEMWKSARRARIAKRLHSMKLTGGMSHYRGIGLDGLKDASADLDVVRIDTQDSAGQLQDKWAGEVQILLRWRDGTQNAGTGIHPANGRTYTLNYQISGCVKWRIMAEIFLSSLRPRWVFLELVPPYALGMTALSLSIFETIAQYPWS